MIETLIGSNLCRLFKEVIHLKHYQMDAVEVEGRLNDTADVGDGLVEVFLKVAKMGQFERYGGGAMKLRWDRIESPPYPTADIEGSLSSKTKYVASRE